VDCEASGEYEGALPGHGKFQGDPIGGRRAREPEEGAVRPLSERPGIYNQGAVSLLPVSRSAPKLIGTCHTDDRSSDGILI
jgi:hypothetical protein